MAFPMDLACCSPTVPVTTISSREIAVSCSFDGDRLARTGLRGGFPVSDHEDAQRDRPRWCVQNQEPAPVVGESAQFGPVDHDLGPGKRPLRAAVHHRPGDVGCLRGHGRDGERQRHEARHTHGGKSPQSWCGSVRTEAWSHGISPSLCVDCSSSAPPYENGAAARSASGSPAISSLRRAQLLMFSLPLTSTSGSWKHVRLPYSAPVWSRPSG